AQGDFERGSMMKSNRLAPYDMPTIRILRAICTLHRPHQVAQIERDSLRAALECSDLTPARRSAPLGAGAIPPHVPSAYAPGQDRQGEPARVVATHDAAGC